MTDPMPGRPIWIALFTADTDDAKAFYGELFGWTVEKISDEYGGYAVFLRDGEPIAGLMANDREEPNAWTVYLETNDAGDTVEMVKANGGEVVVDAMEVGGGHVAVVRDPAGAVVGAWQPGAHSGFATRGEVGAPAWFEVLSNDYERAVSFYENVFGWVTHTMSDTPELRYTTLGRDDHALAGILDANEMLAGRPSQWVFYLQVEDTDATVARAHELGGSEVTAPQDTPYGRIATIGDPAGVQVMAMGPNRG